MNRQMPPDTGNQRPPIHPKHLVIKRNSHLVKDKKQVYKHTLIKNIMNSIKKISDFEKKHKILSFIIIVSITILSVRVITLFIDPNPFVFRAELHHFYYGVLLLMIVSLILLFKKGKFEINLLLTGLAFGLIIDEFVFILSKTRGAAQYSLTLYPTIAITIVFISIILCIKVISNCSKKYK
jgi:hypothetical protein